MFARSPFNYDPNEMSDLTAQLNDEPSLTQQQFKDECDINTIVKRFGITGQLPTNVRQPMFEDFVDVMDFQSAMNAIRAAEAAFAAMPAHVRERFAHDPQRFLEFCEDDRNRDEAIKLGLVEAPLTSPPTPTPPPVNP